MNTKEQVLKYLERNNDIVVSNTGTIVSRKKIEGEKASSRNSSAGSHNSSRNSSRNSRSSSPQSFRESKTNSTKGQAISMIYDLLDFHEEKYKANSKFAREENKLLTFLQTLIEQEKKHIVIPKNYEEDPEIRRRAEILAKTERMIETFLKENKAMKTLLAELTLSQVDAKIINSSSSRQSKIENLTTSAYIKRQSRLVNDDEDYDEIDTLESLDEYCEDYGQNIEVVVNVWIKEIHKNYESLSKKLCKRIVIEQETRLVSEESADNLIAEKERIIRKLESKIQKVKNKSSKENKK
ncbi:hypothetical protein SteCoe_2874 [Stentor coeruleus]|uniref:Uncharacterized protein n=1 Tax=Stentor coeruleus TaxID=5963 RepID=A0A1R2CYL1_9CILI|nr:hypothetical protein SteCoe_2874 [Stentor coeruleus]